MECNEIVSCDWFSFSVLLPLTDDEKLQGVSLSCPVGYTLKEYGGTNIYRRRFMLFNEFGEKSLTLLLEPYSKLIKPNSMFVEIANRLLYRDFSFVLDLLAAIHNYTFQSISRYDVCCDFNPSVHQWQVIEWLQDGGAYVTGKREGAMFYDYIIPDSGGLQKRVARCLSWGSKQSNIRWKLYNKSLEITELNDKGVVFCTKPYIRDMWVKNGLDPENVWRLEVSIMGAASYQWRGEKLNWSCHEIAFYTPFFWDIYAYRFVIRANQGHKNRGHDEVLPFLSVQNGDHYRLKKCEPRNEVFHTDHAVTLRACMKELERDEVKVYQDMAEIWLSTAQEVITLANLEQFFLNCWGVPFDKFKQQYYNQNFNQQ